ncbi:MAG: helix-turn-helix transcriptional regulator [Oligoflexia bacterium]|nr:helix-turn-helix transcriptional regulator [Oligoflexia bacterium]
MSTKKIKYGVRDVEVEYGPLTFAKVLESHRLSEDMSQREFSELLGISQQSLCDLEKGRKIPTPERAARIAKKLEEPADYWIKLSLQDMLRAQNFDYEVNLSGPSKRKKVSGE